MPSSARKKQPLGFGGCPLNSRTFQPADILFNCFGDPLQLHPFPTRRSSDLSRSSPRPCDILPPCRSPAMVPATPGRAARSPRSRSRPSSRATCTADRKSTRLNSSHSQMLYAVFCSKKTATRVRRLPTQQQDFPAGRYSVQLLRRPATTPPFPYTTLFRSLPKFPATMRYPAAVQVTRDGAGDSRTSGAIATEPVPTFEPGDLHGRSEEHTSELQSQPNVVCRLLLEKNSHSGSEAAHSTAGLSSRPIFCSIASATRYNSTLSLHDALPISPEVPRDHAISCRRAGHPRWCRRLPDERRDRHGAGPDLRAGRPARQIGRAHV